MTESNDVGGCAPLVWMVVIMVGIAVAAWFTKTLLLPALAGMVLGTFVETL